MEGIIKMYYTSNEEVMLIYNKANEVGNILVDGVPISGNNVNSKELLVEVVKNYIDYEDIEYDQFIVSLQLIIDLIAMEERGIA